MRAMLTKSDLRVVAASCVHRRFRAKPADVGHEGRGEQQKRGGGEAEDSGGATHGSSRRASAATCTTQIALRRGRAGRSRTEPWPDHHGPDEQVAHEPRAPAPMPRLAADIGSARQHQDEQGVDLHVEPRAEAGARRETACEPAVHAVEEQREDGDRKGSDREGQRIGGKEHDEEAGEKRPKERHPVRRSECLERVGRPDARDDDCGATTYRPVARKAEGRTPVPRSTGRCRARSRRFASGTIASRRPGNAPRRRSRRWNEAGRLCHRGKLWFAYSSTQGTSRKRDLALAQGHCVMWEASMTYGTTARLLHWIVAVFVISMFTAGLVMTEKVDRAVQTRFSSSTSPAASSSSR